VGEIDVFNHFKAEGKRPLAEREGEIVVRGAQTEVETACPGVGNAFLRGVDSRDLPAFSCEDACGGAVAAAKVKDTASTASSYAFSQKPTRQWQEIGVRAGWLG
jgi:hypothetical protein